MSLKVHCFIYRCSECYKPYNQCFCYCQTCRTYLRFCKQLYFKDGDMTEDDLEDIVALCFKLMICLFKSYCTVLYTMDETSLKLLKVIEEKDIAVKELSNRLEGFYTVTRHLLERINYNLVENQISSVEVMLVLMK